MSDEQHRDPELPSWVQDLITMAEERGYGRGFEEGQKQLWYRIQADMNARRPFGA